MPKEKYIEPKKVDIIKAFYWTESGLYILDQRKLPQKEVYYKADTYIKVKNSIKNMLVRGAPAIGIVGAIGFYIGVKNLEKILSFPAKTKDLLMTLKRISSRLSSARPTAFNLFWALERMYNRALTFISEMEIVRKRDWKDFIEGLKLEALAIWEEDIEGNLKMSELGATLLPEGGILTHCNTGALATGGYGTALGVIRKAYEMRKKILIYADETRPFLQGARLTAWELAKLKIPYKIITDNAAGFLMKKGLIQAVIVGADRITKNGDTANKIGTYSLAVLAKAHGIPFYVCAPSSTFDFKLTSGEEIPIEERNPKEVLFCRERKIAPKNAQALNLVFDVTPSHLISAIITEKGIIHPPYEQNLEKVLKNGKN
ncbi:MAG: S-methyl-5-thioribose-1-phosphate isomerase [Caldimicrobium sp.]